MFYLIINDVYFNNIWFIKVTFQAEEIKIVRLPEFIATNSINKNAVNTVMQLVSIVYNFLNIFN